MVPAMVLLEVNEKSPGTLGRFGESKNRRVWSTHLRMNPPPRLWIVIDGLPDAVLFLIKVSRCGSDLHIVCFGVGGEPNPNIREMKITTFGTTRAVERKNLVRQCLKLERSDAGRIRR